MSNMVTENLKVVEKNIEEACKRAGRDRNEVTLIAVSKIFIPCLPFHLEKTFLLL